MKQNNTVVNSFGHRFYHLKLRRMVGDVNPTTYGAIVYWLGHRPFKAGSGVRISVASPHA